MFASRKFVLMLLSLALMLGLAVGPSVLAVTSASISFGSGDQPSYSVIGSNPVNEVSGCDIVTMMMTDATGQITDIDTFCLSAPGGTGSDWTDWGSYQGGYVATLGPIAYTLYDTSMGDACYNDENSAACGALLLSGSVAGIAEECYQPPSLQVGTCYRRLSGGTTTEPGCNLPIPSGSVVGAAPSGAQIYWEPGKPAQGWALNPGTYIVVGQDASQTYYKVVLACQFVWVEKAAMGPSFQAPQNGAPLPTRVVN